MPSTIHYGYTDGSGDYYITIGASCDGCAQCVEACPAGVLEMIVDDYDEPAAAVGPAHRKDLQSACAPCKLIGGRGPLACQQACAPRAISHSW
jgi:ferredoxin